MARTAEQIKCEIKKQLEYDHFPFSSLILDKDDYCEDFTPEEIQMMKDYEEEERSEEAERIKHGFYTIFVLQGDLDRIENEIIEPLKTELKEDERKQIELEFKRLSVETVLSSYHSIEPPVGKHGGVLVIEGIERLDNNADYVRVFSRLTAPPVQTTENGSFSRWSLLFITKECENEKFLFNSTWNYYRQKSRLLNLKLA